MAGVTEESADDPYEYIATVVAETALGAAEAALGAAEAALEAILGDMSVGDVPVGDSESTAHYGSLCGSLLEAEDILMVGQEGHRVREEHVV